MRQFLYLLRNNGLSLNNTLNAIDNTISPNCTFCRILDRDTNNRDSFAHFFRECPITIRLLEGWCTIFEPLLDINSPSFQVFYWYGSCPDIAPNHTATPLLVDSFKYVRGKFKKRKKIPNVISFKRELIFTLENICLISRKVRASIANSNFSANFLPVLG